MGNEGFGKRFEREVLSGTSILPFANQWSSQSNGRCYLPNTPNKVKVRKVSHNGKGFYSVPEGSYDIEQRLEDAREMLADIDCSLLGEYNPKVEYVQGINGPIPKDGALDSMHYDNRITFRPVGLREVCSLDFRVEYDNVSREIATGTYINEPDVALNLENFMYCPDSEEGIDGAGRLYLFEGGPLRVDRYPTWLNVNTTGAEKIGRVPLEVLTSALEPYTTQRAVNGLRGLCAEHEEDVGEARLIGREEQVEHLGRNTVEGAKTLFNEGLIEERSVATGIVKSWLLRNANRKGLTQSEIIDWNPYSQAMIHDSALAQNIQEELERCTPDQMIRFYGSNVWDHWRENGGEIDVSQIDFPDQ